MNLRVKWLLLCFSAGDDASSAKEGAVYFFYKLYFSISVDSARNMLVLNESTD